MRDTSRSCWRTTRSQREMEDTKEAVGVVFEGWNVMDDAECKEAAHTRESERGEE